MIPPAHGARYTHWAARVTLGRADTVSMLLKNYTPGSQFVNTGLLFAQFRSSLCLLTQISLWSCNSPPDPPLTTRPPLEPRRLCAESLRVYVVM